LVIPEAAEDRAQLLMYVLEGRSLVILETSLSEELLNQLLPELFAETGATSVRYDIPGGMMLLPDRLAGFELPGDGYLNLTLG
jgi:CRP-like cAMP-binding protein